MASSSPLLHKSSVIMLTEPFTIAVGIDVRLTSDGTAAGSTFAGVSFFCSASSDIAATKYVMDERGKRRIIVNVCSCNACSCNYCCCN